MAEHKTPEAEAYVQVLRRIADLERELAAAAQERDALRSERDEVHEREAGTAEVLRVISRSPESLDAALQAVADTAARVCRADFARVFLRDGDYLCPGPSAPPAPLDGGPFPPDEPLGPIADLPGSLGDAARTAQTVHLGDVLAYQADHKPASQNLEALQQYNRRAGTRTLLVMPLLLRGEVVGLVVLIRRDVVRPFNEREIALAETFADQAAIAVENARLFKGLQERNTDLAEALEQQTATADILRIISEAPADLQHVLDTLVANAVRLCSAPWGIIYRREDNVLRFEATSNRDADSPFARQGPAPCTRGSIAGRAILDGEIITDFGTPEDRLREYPDTPKPLRPGILARVAVPLVRKGQAVGAFVIARPEPRRFSDREIALLQTFADQAVIAMENARLFDELQARNYELTEALEQQTSTGDILRVIGQTPTKLPEVFNTMCTSAMHLTGSDGSSIRLLDGSSVRLAWHSRGEHLAGMRLEESWDLGTSRTGADRAIQEHRTVHLFGGAENVAAEFPATAEQWRANGATASQLCVPLLKDGGSLGVLLVWRANPQPYSAAQVALLETFADQAVIAMENARLFEELQARTRELEAASLAKSEFLSRMSHELRTPLNAIIGFGEIMEMDAATTPRQQERVRHILAGGRHLLGLINEVLDITRIEAGRLSLSLEPVPLGSVVQEVLDLERPLAAEAKVELALDDPEAFHVAVQADRQRLRQIVLNLVANAIKYNRAGGRVTLSVHDEQGGAGNGPSAMGGDRRIRLTVRDTGRGIAPEQIGRLFAAFERLSAEGSGVEGTGLGLAIARGLCEVMGGAIGVESVVGEGSTFWVELSAASVLTNVELSGGVTEGPGGGVQDHTRQIPGDGTPTPLTVLYIEDNEPNVEVVRQALEFRPGVTLLTAPDGATGISIARRYRPGLILLDLNLPDLQGDEVLATLRADVRTRATPVVMVSADATRGRISRLRAAGARDYLTKPLDVKRLLSMVDDLSGVTRAG